MSLRWEMSLGRRRVWGVRWVRVRRWIGEGNGLGKVGVGDENGLWEGDGFGRLMGWGEGDGFGEEMG